MRERPRRMRDVAERSVVAPCPACRPPCLDALRRGGSARRVPRLRAPGQRSRPLVYLDSASTTQKPRAVIDALVRSYEETANIHRGVHTLSVEATDAYEAVRGKAAALLGATDPRGDRLRPRHHRGDEPGRAELRPRQCTGRRRGADHAARAPLEPRAVADALRPDRRHLARAAHRRSRPGRAGAKLDELLGPRTRIVALAHVSNSLGTVATRRRDRAAARGPSARSPWSTARRRSRTGRSTSPRSAATSTPSPGTSCTARPAAASSGVAARCSRRCPPGRAAAT